MAAPKRKHVEPTEESVPAKTATIEDDVNLASFVQWCDDENFQLKSKVTVGKEGSCANYGMVALEDIPAGYCIFQVPRTSLLSPENSGIADILKQDAADICSESGWVPLLLALMHEYTNPKSKWKPYLQLLPPTGEELDPPMFWPKSELDSELTGTGIPKSVNRDLINITKEFNEVVLTFVLKHPSYFTKECQNIEFYKKMVAYVMAYSFSEPVRVEEEEDDEEEDDETDTNPPFMVPMADILNHVAKNNAHLTFGKESLKMVTTKNIKKGEEVFNTYGHLSNHELLHMYGFAEAHSNNHYDRVEMRACHLHKIAKSLQGGDNEIGALEEKWKFLEEMGLVLEDSTFVLGVEGILTEEEVYQTLKILVMSAEEFATFETKDGWIDDDDDDVEEDSMTNENIPKLPKSWKKLLYRLSEECLEEYKMSPEEEETLREEEKEGKTKLGGRQKFSHFVRYGQMKLLKSLQQLCTEATS